MKEKISIMPGDSLVECKRHFVIPNSDSLQIGNQLLKQDKDYQFDYRHGRIHLFHQPFKPETLWVSYQAMPVDVKPSYQYLPFVLWQENAKETAAQGKKAAGERNRSSSELFDDSQLRKSGSLTRSITVGNNQGLRLDSGLRLQLEGNITSDINVVAALSDQNTPIQPEGNTQSLREVDKVYIQIENPRFQARLGDFHVNYQTGRFGNYQRKLQGAQLSLSRGSLRGSVSGAVSRGKFHTNRFKGEEGKQGPYQLRGEQGETEIIVMAGTERVWVDGEPMTRGQENDYVIEYGSGQITFTRNRLITGDSRIVVDFEYSNLKFQRNLYSGQVMGKGWEDRLQFKAVFVREADDMNNLLEADIGDEDEAYLAEIGDQIDSAFVESGEYVGKEKGSYVKIDSNGTAIYRYVGENKGDHNVRFSYVGGQAGEYRYAGGGEYQYVGANQGNYTPRRFLPVAQSQNLGSFHIQLDPTSYFHFTGEMALSESDRNMWSSIDDDDNVGSAFQLQASLAPKSIRIKNNRLGQLKLSGLWRHQGKRFFEITRNRQVEYNRKWDLPEESGQGEVVRELKGAYEPVKGIQFRADLGEIGKGDWFHSRRRVGYFDLHRKNWPDISYREEHIRRSDDHTQVNGNWIRRLGKFQYKIWRFKPHFRYEFEDKRDRTDSDSLRTGFVFDDMTAGLGIQLAEPLELSYAQTIRRDQRVADQQLKDNSEAYSQKFTVQLSRWHHLKMDFTYTNRVRTYRERQPPEKRTRLADINLAYSPFKRALRSDVRLQMSTTQISKTEQFYFKVEQGRGNYRFDEELNEYVPDPFGRYILRTLATGEFEPVNDLLINGKLNIKPRLLWMKSEKPRAGWQKVLSSLAWETYFSMNEKSRRDNPWRLHLDRTGLSFPDQETVFGNYVVRQDIHLFENVSDRSLRFRWLENFRKNNRLTEGGQYSMRQEQSLRFTARLSKRFSLKSTVAQQKMDRIFQSTARVNRRILSHGGDVRLSYRPRTNLEIAAELALQRDLDRVHSPETKTILTSVKPNFSYAFRGRGRLRGELEFSSVKAKPENRIIPYEMADGRRVGENFRWQLGLDYRLSSKLMILVSYLGRKNPLRDEVLHLGKAEVKAFF